MEGCGEREDHLAVLDRLAAAGSEAAPVAQAVDLIDDGHRRVAAEQEIGMERMRSEALDRAFAATRAWAMTRPPKTRCQPTWGCAPKQVVLDLLEIEDFQQIGDGF